MACQGKHAVEEQVAEQGFRIFIKQEGMSMLGTRLIAGLMVGAGLFVNAATLRADDTIVLKRVKTDVPAQTLQRDRGDAEIQDAGWHGGHYGGHYVGHYGGHYRGHYGGWHGYGSYRPYWGSYYRYGYGRYWGGPYYRYGYYPRISIGIYDTAPVYYYPSYYYSSPSIYVAPSYYPISEPSTSVVPTVRLKLDKNPAEIRGEDLPAPRLEKTPDKTFPYDGAPQVPVPMPRPDPASKMKPATDPKDEGKVVSLPAKSANTYPAYGDKPFRSAFEDHSVVIKDNEKKPSK